MTLQIKTAAGLVDPALEARWTTRRLARETEILQAILRAFVERPDPIVVEEFIRAFPERAPDDTRAALTRLDEDDLIEIRDGRVDLAYPFSATPTSFVVHLSGRGDRYVCCAIDALGVAPMLGSRCASGRAAIIAGSPLSCQPIHSGRGRAPKGSWSGRENDATASGGPRPQPERPSTSSGRKSI
ncbi:MAG: organomercurial lyase [Candidatus Rokubacteria bacterium]|nr:organomercurial lyase [Candidatus Rokubacteria bacterium]